jgi:hypothetical protein
MTEADDNQGWICLHRKFMTWEWFTDPNVTHLFIYCLLRANYKATKWRGISVPKGGLITSHENLAKATGLSVKQVRTALDKLKRTGEVASESTNNFSIITVVNWEKYQEQGKPEGRQRADEGQAEGKQRATDNKDNNINKDNKEDGAADFSGAVIRLTESDFVKFRERASKLSEEEFLTALKKADDYFYGEILEGKKNTRWFFRLGEWLDREVQEKIKPTRRSLGYTPLGVGG